MAACRIGEFAKSKAGHDKEQVFVIINIENEYVYLVDGKSRKLESPKKKKLKHIQVINKIDDNLLNKIQSGNNITNEEVKRAIKLYVKNGI
ncbi:MAG: KOW domain-containing RNA-binding protein [Lachnospiraceae bacterium]|nr:KOW domain-containing RNA-binding protein [Lachnospiraceae bacterium]